MLSRVDDIAFRIPTVFINIFLIFGHILTILYKSFKIFLTSNFRTSTLNDSPTQTFRITSLDISLLQIGSRLSPRPTVTGTVTCTSNHRQGTTQSIHSIVHVLNFKQTFLIVIMVHTPYIAEVVHQFIFLLVNHVLQNSLRIAPLFLIQIHLTQQSQGCTTSRTSHITGTVLTALRQHFGRRLQIVFNKLVNVLYRRTGYALYLLR